MNQQLTFPQDVVPRHHRKGTAVADSSNPEHDPLRADGPEPTPTARTRR
jgi:hypothetical protein